MKFEVPQRQQLASERTSLTLFAPAPSSISFVPLTRNLSLADPSPYPGVDRPLRGNCHPLFCAPEGAGRGLLSARGSLKTRRVPQKAVLRTECLRKRVAYHRRLFCAPNICSVPKKGVSGTEYHSRTRKACSAHRVPLKMHRVPQEPVFCTARIFRTTGGPLRYRMPQTRRSHILRRRLPRHQHHHYGHPPHGSRLGQETTALRKNLRNFFKKLRELSRSFFIFVPNKYRNTQCKLFTTNTTNSWNLPR